LKRPKVSDYKHRITICTSVDVVEGPLMVMTRKTAFDTWASIRSHRGALFSKDGVAIQEQRSNSSHEIMIRYRTDREISATAWIYEQRLKSSPRWFKVLSVEDADEDSRVWKFRCRLVERADDVSKPVEPSGAMPLPEGVNL
jgi:head-tail adaptor